MAPRPLCADTVLLKLCELVSRVFTLKPSTPVLLLLLLVLLLVLLLLLLLLLLLPSHAKSPRPRSPALPRHPRPPILIVSLWQGAASRFALPSRISHIPLLLQLFVPSIIVPVIATVLPRPSPTLTSTSPRLGPTAPCLARSQPRKRTLPDDRVR